MRTTLYLVRHGATAANLSKPAKLQGCRIDPPLDPIGIRQADATRASLAHITFAACYSSPLVRAMQTAALVAPHLTAQPIPALTECDVGRWQGIDWETIRQTEADEYARYMSDPSTFGYPEGESFADVHQRASAALEQIIERHTGNTLLIVSHHVVFRSYLATVLGLPLRQARQVELDNCGVSTIVRDGNKTKATMLNSTLHLAQISSEI